MNSNEIELRFDHPFDERAAFETESRGYFSAASAAVNGRLFPLSFYDPVRLAQDLESSAANGEPFVAEQNMIVLQAVTRENMERAVRALANRGYFKADV
jgi:hypothetical protein